MEGGKQTVESNEQCKLINSLFLVSCSLFLNFMIQLRSKLTVADNTGAKKLRVYLIHGGSKRVYGYVGNLVDASVIEAVPNSTYPAGTKVKAVVVRTRQPFKRSDGSRIRFDDNAGVILSTESPQDPAGTRIFGPIAREVKDAGYSKIASLAEEVI